ncbi:MAG: ABC transporter permease [Acidobacteria bacterium]|nr:ABC transporter permease [Acidobacteriota bacterium]
MSLWSRIVNVLRGDGLNREIDQELQSHIEEAIEQGRDPAEVRRAFGSRLRMREESRDIKLAAWLDSLRADVVFGWRQLHKQRTASAASIVSLALAIGAATAAFRLVDAVLLRPLPVAEPERLYFVATTYFDREGRPDYRDDFDYPTYRRCRELITDRAEPMVVGSVNNRQEVRFEGAESERLRRQYVSGNVFPSFGLKPELGRLLTPGDDVTPGGHPVAVLSYDYWTRRFARDPGVIGRTFQMGKYRLEIVGVAPGGFIGTEPGEIVDLFVPAMMNAEALDSPGWSWFRMWVRLRPGVSPEQVRQPLEAAHIQTLRDNLKNFASDTPREAIERHLNQKLILLSAASGASNLQKDYQRPLLILGLLVALVLLIACANVANLMTAQAAARSREMALRVSIGAGRARLMQLVLIECAMVAAFASTLGGVFAAWSAPLVVSMLRMPEDPVRLVLETGWRELAFSFALALLVTLLFGLAAALRASAVQPVHALRGGEDSGAPRRPMKLLLSAQVAFCVTVLFVAGLFLVTFHRLSTRPLGFSPDNLLVMDVSAQGQLPPEAWFHAADELRGAPGVLSVGASGWPLLSGNRWTGAVRLPGQRAEAQGPYMLDVSPNYFAVMGIALIAGRDFRRGDRQHGLKAPAEPVAGVGIVNEAFARIYFRGENPVGRSVDLLQKRDLAAPVEIIGLVRNSVYYNLREPLRPMVFVPMKERGHVTLLARTAVDPSSLAPTLRQKISLARPGLRVQQIQPHSSFIRWRLVRERLLATLSLFFAVVALVLAAVGLYGVLNYSVTRRRREIGIRMALGARAGHIVRVVTGDAALIVCLGSLAGVAAGVVAGRLVGALLYEVKPTGLDTMAAPILTLALVALVASLPPAFRAARVDPAQTLRSE